MAIAHIDLVSSRETDASDGSQTMSSGKFGHYCRSCEVYSSVTSRRNSKGLNPHLYLSRCLTSLGITDIDAFQSSDIFRCFMLQDSTNIVQFALHPGLRSGPTSDWQLMTESVRSRSSARMSLSWALVSMYRSDWMLSSLADRLRDMAAS